VPRTNPKPLRLAVTHDIFETEAIKAFINKGHEVFITDFENTQPDVVIGPRCWRIDPQLKLGDDVTEEESLERQLEMMERGIRNIKYPKEKKDVTQ
jgi:hypothetical protein